MVHPPAERGVRRSDGGLLDLYHEERERPVVCFDESSKQLLGEVRYDTEYQRTGPGIGSCSVNRRVGGGISR